MAAANDFNSMKGVSDLFISKDKLALFWFFMACACLVTTAWYLHRVALEGRSRMLYVAIDQPIIDRLITPDDRGVLIDYQARLALESYLNRGPLGPLTGNRIPNLFVGDALAAVAEDVNKDSYEFRSRETHQLAEIGSIEVLHNDDGSANTHAVGQVLRMSIDPVEGQVVNQSFFLKANLTWVRNMRLRDVKRFPFVCTAIKYELIENLPK